jgi:hypothetical protein
MRRVWVLSFVVDDVGADGRCVDDDVFPRVVVLFLVPLEFDDVREELNAVFVDAADAVVDAKRWTIPAVRSSAVPNVFVELRLS